MNATRLFSTLYGQTLNVGRVMTPTLAMIVQRKAEIESFKPEPIYRLSISCGGITAVSDRFEKKEDAENVLKVLEEQKTAQVIKIDPADKQEKVPQLYSLTALQRDANRFLGFTAQQTLDYTQSLYEKKLVTYPRTDSRFLTEDMEKMIPDLARKMASKFGYTKNISVYPKQVINNSKVSDHHAIIPTVNVADAEFGKLPFEEQKVLSLITARLLSALGESAVISEVDVEFTCADTVFKTKTKNLTKKGWREIQDWIMGSSMDSENDKEEKSWNANMQACIAMLTNENSYPLQNPRMEEGKTTPKKHFTEDSLLSAMERAGADEMPDEAERKGLGTPATRAATIEKLVQRGFIERKDDKKIRQLIATDKGNSLITVMPEQIQSASMTAEWEQKLLQVERSEMDASDFMPGIEGMIMGLVTTYEKVKGADALMSRNKVIGTCPHCGAEVLERQKGWFCSNWECRFVLWKGNAYFTKIGKRLTPQIVEKLLRNGRVRLKDCKSQKTGKTYNADLLLSTEADGRPQFSMEFENRKGGGK